MDEITDQQLSSQYDSYSQHHQKLTNELKMLIVSDDKIRKRQLEKKVQIIHVIMQQILKLRSQIFNEKTQN